MDNGSSRSDSIVQACDKTKSPSNQTSCIKTDNKQRSTPTTSSNKDILVYIPDILSSIPETDVEHMIQTRLGTIHSIIVSKVEYHSRLGIAVIHLADKKNKTHLVSNVQSIVLDPKRGINVSFVGEIDLESYVVLDRRISTISSSDDVARRYAQAYRTQQVPACESISAQFPNIFRMVHSMNLLMQLIHLILKLKIILQLFIQFVSVAFLKNSHQILMMKRFYHPSLLKWVRINFHQHLFTRS